MNLFKDIRGYLWFYFYLFRRNLNYIVSTVIIRLICLLKGIKVGNNNKFLGIPVIKRYPFSTIEIGNGCRLNSSKNSTDLGIYKKCRIVTVHKNANIKIGNHVGMSGVTILCANSIEIMDNVLIGAHSIIIDTDRHHIDPILRLQKKPASAPVIIESHAWIGMNVSILKGVSIGKNSIIGANSVVVKSIPENVIAAGNPCKVIKQIDR